MRQFLREMKALVWKEWRQGWKVLLLAILLSGVVVGYYTWWESGANILEVQVVTWMVIAGMFGAPLFAGEAESQGTAFLATQPIRPALLWAGKVSCGLLLLSLFIVFTFAADAALAAYKEWPLFLKNVLDLPDWAPQDRNRTVSNYLTFGLPVVIFSMSVLSSCLLKRTLDAFLLSLVLAVPGYVGFCRAGRDLYKCFRCDIALTLVVGACALFLAPSAAWFLSQRWRLLKRILLALSSGVAVVLLIACAGVEYLHFCEYFLIGDYQVQLVFPAPDAQTVAAEVRYASRTRRIWIIPTDGSRAWLAPGGEARSWGRERWSPDGSQLVYTHWRSLAGHDSAGRILNVRTGASEAILRQFKSVESVGFLPANGGLGAIIEDGEQKYVRIRADGPHSVADICGRVAKGLIVGTWLVIESPGDRSSNAQKFLLNENTLQRLDLGDIAGEPFGVSPGGRYVVYRELALKPDRRAWLRCRDMQAKTDITLASWADRQIREGGAEAPLPSELCDPEFSSDERWVAFSTYPAGKVGPSWLCDLSRGGAVRTVAGRFWWGCFSPDSRWCSYKTFHWDKDGRLVSTYLHMVDLDKGEDRTVCKGTCCSGARFSPDGTKMAWSSMGREEDGIRDYAWVLDLATVTATQLPVKDIHFRAWLDKDRLLVNDSMEREIYIVNADGTGLRRIFP